MSKAFTRESDEAESYVLPVRAPLPAGVKNYITAAGAERLRDEMERLLAAQPPGDSANRAPGFREARLRQLQEIIPSLVIADPPADKSIVRFGAKVTVRRQNETEAYRLVGVDETNLDTNEISWLSPLGKVLLGKRAGDRVRFGLPAGSDELQVLSVGYD